MDAQPQTFGTYVVERELGRGGMGVVYAVVHQVIGRHAAIKVLTSEASRDADLVQRFFNEARAATAIKHPSIVEVYDVGQEAGNAYIVMELLEGESLASRLRTRGMLTIGTTLGLARQCANALAAAHQAGIVHRDLKPDNVFLVPDAEVAGGERVKLLDFGVAKLVGDNNADVARTVTGAILGTPHYMAPEQCEGARAVDHRADLYSLGCMVFQMVAGRLPFQSQGIGGLIGMHLHVDPPKLRSLRPDAPLELERLVARLLAKSPDDRPQTAVEVAEALASMPVTTTTIVPATPTIREAAIETPTIASSTTLPVAKRSRTPWLLAGVGALAITVAIVAATRHDGAAPERTAIVSDAVAPPDALPDAPAIDPQLAEARRRLDAGEFEGAHALALQLLARHPDDPEILAVEGAARHGRARGALEAMRRAPDGAFDDIRRALEIVHDNTPKDDPVRTDADGFWQSREPRAIALVTKQIAALVARKRCAEARTLATDKQALYGKPLGKLVDGCGAQPTTTLDADETKKRDEIARLRKEIDLGMAGGLYLAVTTACRRLQGIAPVDSIPWERCIVAMCKVDKMSVLAFVGNASESIRETARAICPGALPN